METVVLRFSFIVNFHMPSKKYFSAKFPVMECLDGIKLGFKIIIPLLFAPKDPILHKQHYVGFLHTIYKYL